MENKLLKNQGEILGGLGKTFPVVYACPQEDYVEFWCRLDNHDTGKQLCFPILNSDVKERNPYAVVNAIWEYILEYMI
jgi:hypothetical protein